MIKKLVLTVPACCVLILSVCTGQSLREPPRVVYFPDNWFVDLAPYAGFENYPSSGLSAYADFGSNEPLYCYPLHSGHIKGVSDTVSIVVNLQNHDTIDYSITSYQPQSWFTPVIYDVMMNPSAFMPIGDSTVIHYSFQGWYDGLDHPITPPGVIVKERGYPSYHLLYYAWNLPVGTTRVLMTSTLNMPSGVTMLVNYVSPVWVVQSKTLADTLNAFGACATRALEKRNFTISSAWCDSMFSRNSKSVPAYMLRARTYGWNAANDSLLELTAHDSALAILNRFGDAALGDTSNWNKTQWLWYNASLQWETYRRWKLVSGGRKAEWF